MNIFTMMRSGVFIPAQATPNQCGREGHPAYNYKVKIAVSADNALNKRGMILDHALIDNMIIELKIKGSCEEMLKYVIQEVRRMFEDFNIEILGVKADIYSSMAESIAHISLYYVDDKLSDTYAAVIINTLNN